jgi:hypothetical protein
MSGNVHKQYKIVVTSEDNCIQDLGNYEGLSDCSNHSRQSQSHEQFMVASEMHKIFTKEKERLIRNHQVKMDELKVEGQELRLKLARIKEKAEQAFRGDYHLDNYRRVVQEIYNEVRELEID